MTPKTIKNLRVQGNSAHGQIVGFENFDEACRFVDTLIATIEAAGKLIEHIPPSEREYLEEYIVDLEKAIGGYRENRP
jgi:hypothetical protein